jgi:hypothetical protein
MKKLMVMILGLLILAGCSNNSDTENDKGWVLDEEGTYETKVVNYTKDKIPTKYFKMLEGVWKDTDSDVNMMLVIAGNSISLRDFDSQNNVPITEFSLKEQYFRDAKTKEETSTLVFLYLTTAIDFFNDWGLDVNNVSLTLPYREEKFNEEALLLVLSGSEKGQGTIINFSRIYQNSEEENKISIDGETTDERINSFIKKYDMIPPEWELFREYSSVIIKSQDVITNEHAASSILSNLIGISNTIKEEVREGIPLKLMEFGQTEYSVEIVDGKPTKYNEVFAKAINSQDQNNDSSTSPSGDPIKEKNVGIAANETPQIFDYYTDSKVKAYLVKATELTNKYVTPNQLYFTFLSPSDEPYSYIGIFMEMGNTSEPILQNVAVINKDDLTLVNDYAPTEAAQMN